MRGWAAYVSKTQVVCKVFSKYRAAQPLESGEPGLDQRPSGWQLAEPAQLPQKYLCPRTQRGHPTEATAGAGGNAQVRAWRGQGSGRRGPGDLDAGSVGGGHVGSEFRDWGLVLTISCSDEKEMAVDYAS